MDEIMLQYVANYLCIKLCALTPASWVSWGILGVYRMTGVGEGSC